MGIGTTVVGVDNTITLAPDDEGWNAHTPEPPSQLTITHALPLIIDVERPKVCCTRLGLFRTHRRRIDAEGLKELVKQGSGITLMLPALLGSNQSGGDFAVTPLADVSEQFIFALVYRRFGSISKPARQFMNMVTQNGAIKELVEHGKLASIIESDH